MRFFFFFKKSESLLRDVDIRKYDNTSPIWVSLKNTNIGTCFACGAKIIHLNT